MPRKSSAKPSRVAANCMPWRGIRISSAVVNDDGRTALSTVRGKKLKLWDVDSSRELRALAGKYGSVRAVALSRDLQGARADPRSLDAAELQTHRWKWLSRGNGVQVF